ncbi:unnamed protein product [Effrenium voratum]|uniref:C3H1-type domain-containing protein n=1 Tax=Effrenium voratum TaxID=2562239 RepID=A0AA36HQZ0_9DINO|nr:unnamed protein product [Effrenium voratum]
MAGASEFEPREVGGAEMAAEEGDRRKTLLCKQYFEGGCNRGGNCAFAHGETEQRQPPGWQEKPKMKLCEKFPNFCEFGRYCHNAHGQEGDRRKTLLCKQYFEGGCNRGGNCAFAHGETEQRQPPGWQEKPKMKLCEKFPNFCEFGRYCHNAHGQDELQVFTLNTTLHRQRQHVAMDIRKMEEESICCRMFLVKCTLQKGVPFLWRDHARCTDGAWKYVHCLTNQEHDKLRKELGSALNLDVILGCKTPWYFVADHVAVSSNPPFTAPWSLPILSCGFLTKGQNHKTWRLQNVQDRILAWLRRGVDDWESLEEALKGQDWADLKDYYMEIGALETEKPERQLGHMSFIQSGQEDSSLETLLDLLVRRNFRKCVQGLLQSYTAERYTDESRWMVLADVGHQDGLGNTALHKACKEGHLEVLNDLLDYVERKGDMDLLDGLCNKDHETCLDLAKEKPEVYRAVVQSLRNLGKPGTLTLFFSMEERWLDQPPVMQIQLASQDSQLDALRDFLSCHGQGLVQDGISKLMVRELHLKEVPKDRLCRTFRELKHFRSVVLTGKTVGKLYQVLLEVAAEAEEDSILEELVLDLVPSDLAANDLQQAAEAVAQGMLRQLGRKPWKVQLSQRALDGLDQLRVERLSWITAAAEFLTVDGWSYFTSPQARRTRATQPFHANPFKEGLFAACDWAFGQNMHRLRGHQDIAKALDWSIFFGYVKELLGTWNQILCKLDTNLDPKNPKLEAIISELDHASAAMLYMLNHLAPHLEPQNRDRLYEAIETYLQRAREFKKAGPLPEAQFQAPCVLLECTRNYLLLRKTDMAQEANCERLREQSWTKGALVLLSDDRLSPDRKFLVKKLLERKLDDGPGQLQSAVLVERCRSQKLREDLKKALAHKRREKFEEGKNRAERKTRADLKEGEEQVNFDENARLTIVSSAQPALGDRDCCKEGANCRFSDCPYVHHGLRVACSRGLSCPNASCDFLHPRGWQPQAGAAEVLCKYFEQGRCKWGKFCAFAHGSRELVRIEDGVKTLLGKYFDQGNSILGSCISACESKTLVSPASEIKPEQQKPKPTTSEELQKQPHDPSYKTQLCEYFPSGRCVKGEDCTYAHGEEDLRTFPQESLRMQKRAPDDRWSHNSQKPFPAWVKLRDFLDSEREALRCEAPTAWQPANHGAFEDFCRSVILESFLRLIYGMDVVKELNSCISGASLMDPMRENRRSWLLKLLNWLLKHGELLKKFSTEEEAELSQELSRLDAEVLKLATEVDTAWRNLQTCLPPKEGKCKEKLSGAKRQLSESLKRQHSKLQGLWPKVRDSLQSEHECDTCHTALLRCPLCNKEYCCNCHSQSLCLVSDVHPQEEDDGGHANMLLRWALAHTINHVFKRGSDTKGGQGCQKLKPLLEKWRSSLMDFLPLQQLKLEPGHLEDEVRKRMQRVLDTQCLTLGTSPSAQRHLEKPQLAGVEQLLKLKYGIRCMAIHGSKAASLTRAITTFPSADKVARMLVGEGSALKSRSAQSLNGWWDLYMVSIDGFMPKADREVMLKKNWAQEHGAVAPDMAVQLKPGTFNFSHGSIGDQAEVEIDIEFNGGGKMSGSKGLFRLERGKWILEFQGEWEWTGPCTWSLGYEEGFFSGYAIRNTPGPTFGGRVQYVQLHPGIEELGQEQGRFAAAKGIAELWRTVYDRFESQDRCARIFQNEVDADLQLARVVATTLSDTAVDLLWDVFGVAVAERLTVNKH